MPNPKCAIDGKPIPGRVILQPVIGSGALRSVCWKHRFTPVPVPDSEPLLSQKGIEVLMEKEAQREKRGLRGPFKRPNWAYENS